MLRPLFLYSTYELVQIFITFNRTDVSLFKQLNKYGKIILLILLNTLYKAQRMSESLFSHSLVAVFPYSFFLISFS